MQLPDSPKIPKFMQLLQWIYQPLQLMENSAKVHGDCFTLWLTNKQPMVFLSHPQAIQQLFTENLSNLDSRGSAQVLQPLLGENSLILLSGTSHQRQRKLLTPPFHGDRMKAYGNIIADITKEVISQWKFDQAFSVRDSMQEISLRVILQAVFGITEGERYTQLQKLLASILDLSGSNLRATISFLPIMQVDLGSWSPWGIFLRQREQIDQLLYAEIQERRNHPESSGNDILSLMMSARDENGEPMTDVELRDELMTLLVAGHETTASALTWALYWIHRQPQIREKLLSELDSFGNNAALEEITRLPYLTAVCQETLRIYPIAMITIPRIVKQPIEIMNRQFDPGTLLVGCIYLTHRRSDLYAEPQQFKPERFLERQYSLYEYLPFGGSNRRCLGMAFALFEMKLVLATVLSHVDLALVDDSSVKPIRRGVTLAPSNGKWMIATGLRQKAETPIKV
ncbi:cytochrome P450 [Nostoc sp. FACHB-87]|uniref:cytochrome P450 n=1 Tax=Nostocales TaxID=1161 RepID=UPI001683935F|nr:MULTISPECIES: cytochrome P450 [Nostocales]MBD2459367.1 cytochrome P450 [Nostoc sp. FACHB-87]MBD2478282.1 cytochrome P450 [Anabaena sp. FACHB-83]MBD2487831.1 cytochrome P450 [Aulosira sp. FACHB-615]